MKNPIIYGISLCLLVMSLAIPSYAIDFGGFITSGVESVENDDESSMALNNYLNLNVNQIGVPDLSFYGYGRYNVNLKDDQSFGDLYLGYLEYRTFQGATDIMLGRFDLVTNRFMTLDGISATQVLPFHVGLSAFVGVPRYKDAEELDDEFRMTGALAYGGKIFLSGVNALQLNVNFYNEEGDNGTEDETIVYKRTVGAGGAYFKNFGTTVDPVALTVEALADQDIENDVLARMSARIAFQYHRFQVAISGDSFDVEDQYPMDRELIIRMISSGEETRYGATANIDLFRWLNLYAGYTMTSVEMRSGYDSDGSIIRAGADLM
ncbi:MAG: hypothetical protein LBV09_03465 [Deferribacteraceae bacterium]|jgi:hypothetical protein|nr:hypothetical protein [Deferribacteraceae bacterium]